MADNIWRKLAELTGPCPECRGSGHIYQPVQPVGNEELDCPTCHGTSQVPLIPGLRKPCEEEHKKAWGYFGGRHGGYERATCQEVGCPGWLLVDDDRAIVAALRFSLARWQKVIFEYETDWGLTCILYNLATKKIEAVNDDTYSLDELEAALAQALERALKEENQ